MLKSLLVKILIGVIVIINVSIVSGDSAICETTTCKMACENVFDKDGNFGNAVTSVHLVAKLKDNTYDDIVTFIEVTDEFNGEKKTPKQINRHDCEGGATDYCDDVAKEGYLNFPSEKYKKIALKLQLSKDGSKITAKANLEQGINACQDLKVSYYYKVFNDWGDDDGDPYDWCNTTCNTINQPSTSLLNENDLNSYGSG